MSSTDERDPAALRREVQHYKESLRELPDGGDRESVMRWGALVLLLGETLSKLLDYQQVVDEMEAVEPTLEAFDSLQWPYFHARVLRAGSLVGLLRLQEGLDLIDRLLVEPFKIIAKDGAELTISSSTLGSIAIMMQQRQPSLGESSSLTGWAELGELALRTRVMALQGLGRLDEAYRAACELTAAARISPGKPGRIDRALVKQSQIAFKQHRYDRVLTSVARLVRERARVTGEPTID